MGLARAFRPVVHVVLVAENRCRKKIVKLPEPANLFDFLDISHARETFGFCECFFLHRRDEIQVVNPAESFADNVA